MFDATCMICDAPMPDYDPEMCCSGHECGCMGMPTNPPVCSEECFNKASRSVPTKEQDNG